MMSRMRNIPVAPNSGFGGSGRDKGGSGHAVGSLADMFLGTSLGTSPSPTVHSPLGEEADDLQELKEEDVWETEEDDGEPDLVGSGAGYGYGVGQGRLHGSLSHGRYAGQGHVPASSAKQLEAGDPLRYLGNGHHLQARKEAQGLQTQTQSPRRRSGFDEPPVGSFRGSGSAIAFSTGSSSRPSLGGSTEGFSIPAPSSASRRIPTSQGFEVAPGAGAAVVGSLSGSGHARSAIPIGGVSAAMASAGRLQKQKQQNPGDLSSSYTGSTIATANQSAPVNVPDWSKIYRLAPKAKPVVYSSDEDEDDGTGRKQRLHPHEIVARDYARSQVSTFSMCEGVGRTLKGRDLLEVRNAVLRRTGFLDA